MPVLGLAIFLPPGRAAATDTSSMLEGAVRPRLEKMDSHDPDVSVSADPDRLFRLSDLGVQIPDIGVQIADMGVQIEPI